MDIKDIKKLVDLMVENDLSRVELREGETHILLRRGQPMVAVPAPSEVPVAMAAPPAPVAAPVVPTPPPPMRFRALQGATRMTVVPVWVRHPLGPGFVGTRPRFSGIRRRDVFVR